jgi:arsenate reductase (thioredoxin)
MVMKTSILTLIISLMTLSAFKQPSSVYPEIEKQLAAFQQEFAAIPEERKEILQELADYIQRKKSAGKPISLMFICTHNSRRSHISQLWAQAAADYYGISGIASYSGGTEATAFNERAVRAMREAGFKIEVATDGSNPAYGVSYSNEAPALKVFSKKYDEGGNPTREFAAIMTCSEADQNCPIVRGADFRIGLPYDDPKAFDGTPQETEKYRERVHQIGVEISYAFFLAGNEK